MLFNSVFRFVWRFGGLICSLNYLLLSILLKWRDLHWMRCHILVLLWDLLPHSDNTFQGTQIPNFQQSQEGIISTYHMLVLGLPGALLTWMWKDFKKPSVSRLVSSILNIFKDRNLGACGVVFQRVKYRDNNCYTCYIFINELLHMYSLYCKTTP